KTIDNVARIGIYANSPPEKPHRACGFSLETVCRSLWMTPFRFGILIIISYFVASLVFLSPVSRADDVMLRKAATPSSSSSVQNYKAIFPDNSRNPAQKRRIGLSTVPFKPEPSDGSATEPLVRHGNFPDIRGVVKKVNRSVVAIRMVDPGSSFSLGHLGFSGDSGGRAMGYGSG